jgi:hypothetical protein
MAKPRDPIAVAGGLPMENDVGAAVHSSDQQREGVRIGFERMHGGARGCEFFGDAADVGAEVDCDVATCQARNILFEQRALLRV